jgi:putative membrane protein
MERVAWIGPQTMLNYRNIILNACTIGVYLGGSQVAMAHTDHSGPLTPDHLWHAWNFDPWLLVPLALSALLYLAGVYRLWKRAGVGRGISAVRVAAFSIGVLSLVVALISPLDTLGETLLSAHMVQHGLLIAVAPPLILAGLPGAAYAWMLPVEWRRRLARFAPGRTFAASIAWMMSPLIAAAIHGAVLWIWHVPLVFDAALADRRLHMTEHFTFLATALLFWQSLLLARRSTSTSVAGMAAAFATMLHGGFLGALITFSPNVLFGWYIGRTEFWGLTALADQQLAGLIMWVPLGIVYFLTSLFLAAALVPVASAYSAPGRGEPIRLQDLRNRATPPGFVRR